MMENFVGDIVDQIKRIEQMQRMGEDSKQQLKKELDAILIENKKLIDGYLWENFSDKEKEGIISDRERMDKSYFISAFFDPEYDDYKIIDYQYNPENTNLIKLFVEVPSKAQSLGRAGCWIPYKKETVFFDKNELKDPTELSKSLSGLRENFEKELTKIQNSPDWQNES